MEELIREESKEAEHQVEMNLRMPSHLHLPSSELVLQSSVDPLADAPLVVTPGGRRVKGGRVLPRPFRSMIGR